jgi:hypothetical protein
MLVFTRHTSLFGISRHSIEVAEVSPDDSIAWLIGDQGRDCNVAGRLECWTVRGTHCWVDEQT